MKTPMQELLEYIKTAHTFTFLPEQLAKTIEEKYLRKEKEQTIDFAYGCVQHISREDIEEYYNKTYKQNK